MSRFLFLTALAWCLTPTAGADDFAGSEACVECHVPQHEAWTGSHHDLAMQHATPKTVLGDFNDAEISVGDVSSRFYMRDGKYFVHTDGPDGELAEFEIAYTFGVEPLQQYLVPFPDGRIQALGLAWDSRPAENGGQRWFHIYPGEPIDNQDELHWSGTQQNWNYMCADCHTTNLVKGYNATQDSFNTTWSEIDVGCEACHGPAAPHLKWAALDSGLQAADISKGLAVLQHDRQGVSWTIDAAAGIATRSEPIGQRTETEVCAACHARRGRLSAGVEADPVFLNHHMPAFLTESLYYADGQIKDEVYVWGSFSQSRMHAAGVTCSDCHDPHSLDLRAPGAAVCAQCHLPEKFATREHHGHLVDSAGADCLACHMPETSYMVIDPRRDHSIRIPRPDLSREFGTPNACNQCHTDQSVEWAAAVFPLKFPDAGEPFQDWARAFQQARNGQPQAEVSLLSVINDTSNPDIARATAVLELQGYLSPLSGQVLQQALNDDSPLVRIAALRTLEALPPDNRFPYAGRLLDDPLLAVRIEAGRLLAATPLNQMNGAERAALQRAIGDYISSQQYIADRPESGINLGNLYARTGDAVRAESHYRRAIRLDPGFSPAYLNLADLYRQQGLEAEARKVLDQGLERQPVDAGLHHALGLSLVRGGQLEQALLSLARSTELAPGEARYGYVYGIALNSAGQPALAVEALTAAHGRHPNNLQILQALATIESDRGQFEQARSWAEKMLAVNPADQTAQQLLQQLNPETEKARQ